MSHREEFEKAVDDYADAVAANNDFSGPDSPKVERDAKAAVLRLYDEKPPTRSDLEAVAREAVGRALASRKMPHDGESVHECATCSKLAAEVVTRYLERAEK